MNTKIILLTLLAMSLLSACSSQNTEVSSESSRLEEFIKSRGDILVKIWMEDGKPMVNLEGNVTDVDGFVSSMKKTYQGQSKYILSNFYYLDVGNDVPLKACLQVNYELLRMHESATFLVSPTPDGDAWRDLYQPVLDSTMDAKLCKHYYGAYHPPLSCADLGLKGCESYEKLVFPPPIGLLRLGTALKDTNTMHFRFDVEGNCTRFGNPISASQIKELLADLPNDQYSPGVLVEVDDDLPMHRFHQILDLFYYCGPDFGVMGSAEFHAIQTE